jgi:capsular polysaccharide biosynthesis protein
VFFATADNHVVRESITHWCGEALQGKELFGSLRRRTGGRFAAIDQPSEMTIAGLCVFATSYYEENYFHWHHDILPAVMFAQQLLGGTPFKVIVGKRTDYTEKSLQSFGIPPERVVYLQPGKTVTVERLVFLSVGFSASPGSIHPQIRDVFRNVKEGLLRERSSEAPAGKLFVSRGASQRRLLVNRGELEQRFRARGFDIVDPGVLSYEEQIRIFDEAAIVVGEHGAGITNIGFCRSGVLLVEMFHPDYHDMCYRSLAAVMGVRHAIFAGERDPAHDTPNRREWMIDMLQLSLTKII